MTAADRQRRYRARMRRGDAVWRVRGNEDRIINALIDARRLTEADAVDRQKVEQAVAQVIADWAGSWSKKA